MSAAKARALLSVLESTTRFPSPLGVALKVLDVIQHESATDDELVQIITADPSLTIRILKYANSPMSGIGRSVISADQAVRLLGLRTVKLIVLGFSVSADDRGGQCPRFDAKRYWQNAYLSAVIARHIAGAILDADGDESFTITLIGGLGQLALAHSIPVEYDRVLQLTDSGSALLESEQAVLDTNHLEYLAELLSSWEFPPVAVDAVRYRARPDVAAGEARRLARISNLADRLAPIMGHLDDPAATGRIDLAVTGAVVQQSLGLALDDWPGLVAAIHEDYRRVSGIYDADGDTSASVLDVYRQAHRQATRLGMAEHTERRSMLKDHETLLERASTDALTGTANRARWEEQLGDAVKQAKRGGDSIAVILLDVDRLKSINDTYGHAIGDRMLVAVADAVRTVLREVDVLGRYGGDEFVILLRNTDQTGACLVASRVCETCGRISVEAGDTQIGASVSVGLVVASDYACFPDTDTLIADADEQLYLSKRSGRATWSYAWHHRDRATGDAPAA